MTTRYAIYYAPARDSAWWDFGSRWLGRDEWSGAQLPRSTLTQLIPGEFDRITAEPGRYGFHATLKAPFRLRDGVTEAALLARVRQLAQSRRPVPLEPLVPVLMDGFLALVPAVRNPALGALADVCVTELDDLRAPLTKAEIEKREPDLLDARSRALLDRFGYHLVLERFRFHMTLTGQVDTALAGQVVARIARPVAQLNLQEPPLLDRLCVFAEPRPGAPFLRIADALLPS